MRLLMFFLLAAICTLSGTMQAATIAPEDPAISVDFDILENDIYEMTEIEVVEEEDKCTITLKGSVLGNSVSISGSAKTCKEAADIVQEGFREAIKVINEFLDEAAGN